MQRKYAPNYEYPDVPIDPQSAFWKYHEIVNPMDDPLALMVSCEEDDLVEGLVPGTTYRKWIEHRDRGSKDVCTSIKEGSPKLASPAEGKKVV